MANRYWQPVPGEPRLYEWWAPLHRFADRTREHDVVWDVYPHHFELVGRIYRPPRPTAHVYRHHPALTEARAATARLLYGTDRATHSELVAGMAAWSIVHGLATLWLNGMVPAALGDDPEAISREVAALLRVPRGAMLGVGGLGARREHDGVLHRH